MKDEFLLVDSKVGTAPVMCVVSKLLKTMSMMQGNHGH